MEAALLTLALARRAQISVQAAPPPTTRRLWKAEVEHENLEYLGIPPTGPIKQTAVQTKPICRTVLCFALNYRAGGTLDPVELLIKGKKGWFPAIFTICFSEVENLCCQYSCCVATQTAAACHARNWAHANVLHRVLLLHVQEHTRTNVAVVRMTQYLSSRILQSWATSHPA